MLATLPAVGSFGSSFIADGGDGHGEAAAGDHLQATYRFWLVGHQLERGDAPWLDPYSFQPLVEPQVVLSGWPFGLAFWPLDAAFGPVVAWNLLLLTTIVAAGLLTYGWLRMLALPPGAAAIGGLVFAVAPYRLAQSGVHLLGWIAILMPLALLAYERARAAESARAAHAWGAVSAAAIVSIPLSGQLHLALGAIPLIAVYVAVRAAPLAAAWTAGGLLAAVGVGLAVHLTIVRDSAEGDGRSLAEVGEFSADWVDLISRWRLGGLEQFVYVGWLVPVLAVAGIVLLWSRSRALAAILGTAAIVPSLLALGTNLPLYEWLWDVFPPLRYPRVPGGSFRSRTWPWPRSSPSRRRASRSPRGGARRPRLPLSSSSSRPTCSSSRSRPRMPTPATRRTQRCATSPMDASWSCRSSSPASTTGASTTTTSCRRRGNVPAATRRSCRNRRSTSTSCAIASPAACGCPATRRSSRRSASAS